MLKVSSLGNSICLYILKFKCKMLDIIKIQKFNFCIPTYYYTLVISLISLPLYYTYN